MRNRVRLNSVHRLKNSVKLSKYLYSCSFGTTYQNTQKQYLMNATLAFEESGPKIFKNHELIGNFLAIATKEYFENSVDDFC